MAYGKPLTTPTHSPCSGAAVATPPSQWHAVLPPAALCPSEGVKGARRVSWDPLCGGPELQTFVVDEAMFAASVMLSGGDVALEEMKLPELEEELAARDAVRSGMKAALQRRLHALLMQAAIDARRADAGESGDGDGGEGSDTQHRGQKRGPPSRAEVDSSDEEGVQQ